MSARKDILSNALFDTGGEVEGITFGALSAPRFQILRRRGNSWICQAGDQEDAFALAEILFVLSRSEEQRAAMFRHTAEQWKDAVSEFFESLPDKALDRFALDYLMPAMNALALAQTESEGPGKSGAAPSRATSRSSTKARDKSGSTTSRKHSGSKSQSGKSASAPSSSSSLRTRSGKGGVTAGSTGRQRRKT